MNGAHVGFKRMVVGLPQGRADQRAVDAVADFAELLNIELLATFVADVTLPALAALAGARELRAPEQKWHAIDSTQIARDIDRAVTIARQRFIERVRTRTIKTSFDVLPGAEAMASLLRADDIFAIIEPAHPGENVTLQFKGLLANALQTAGALLIIPRRLVRTVGPIVTVVSDLGDAGIRTALAIAQASKERLVVITAAGARPPLEMFAEAEQAGVQVEHIVGSRPPLDIASLLASTRLQERLRVITRSASTGDVARLFASLQGIPTLLIEPRPAAAADHESNTGHVG